MFEKSENSCYNRKKVKELIPMKKYLLNAPENNVENVIDSLLAEMVLDKALRDFRKKKIQMEIDQSLEKRNKEEFFRLTSELKEIS